MTIAAALIAKGKAEGKAEGSLIGKLTLLQSLMDMPFSTEAELESFDTTELEHLYLALERRYKETFKRK